MSLLFQNNEFGFVFSNQVPLSQLTRCQIIQEHKTELYGFLLLIRSNNLASIRIYLYLGYNLINTFSLIVLYRLFLFILSQFLILKILPDVLFQELINPLSSVLLAHLLQVKFIL